MSEFLAFFGALSARPYRAFARELAGLVERSGTGRVVELCGGHGGPSGRILELLRDQRPDVRWTLTDRHPPDTARQDGVEVVREPVDATAIPDELEGVRVIVNAFHHFAPDMAVSALRSAIASGGRVAVLEVNARHPLFLFGMLLAPLHAWVFAVAARPRRLATLFFSFVVPVLPLLILWDGVVSCLRVYSPGELLVLGQRADPDYEWRAARLPIEGTPAFTTALFGEPRRERRSVSAPSTP